MIYQCEYRIFGHSNKPLLLDISAPAQPGSYPVLVLCHGLKGFKDWGHFPLMARRAAEEGFICIKFSFSHNGTTPEAPMEFADPEAFGNNNFSRELYDLNQVVDWAWTNASSVLPEGIRPDMEKLALAGHSRGGGIAVIHAAEDPRIKALVTWAAVSDFGARLAMYDLEAIEKKGVVYVTNSRTGQKLPMYRQLIEDYLAHRERLDISRAAKALRIPGLFIQGSKDEAVHPAEAENLAAWCRHAQLKIIAGGSHTFGAYHPYDRDVLPEPAREVFDVTVSFLRNCWNRP